MSEAQDLAKAQADDGALIAEASKLPLAEQVAHSNWKIRAHAYDEVKRKAAQVFSSDDAFLEKTGTLDVSRLCRPRRRGGPSLAAR